MKIKDVQMGKYRKCNFDGICSKCGMHAVFLYEKRYTTEKGIYLYYDCMLDDKYN